MSPGLISRSEELTELRLAARRLLREIGQQALCHRRPGGSPGCKREVFVLRLSDGQLRLVDEDLQDHACGEGRR